MVLAVEEASQINCVESRGCSDRVEVEENFSGGRWWGGWGQRLNLVELTQEEAAQRRQLTHVTLFRRGDAF